MNPVFADYMEAYGRGGVKAHGIGPEALVNLTRLYWYTVEFGLIRQPTACASTAAASSSSKGESIHCLESAAPNRIGFDLERIMRTRYRIDTYQKTYFVIDSFEQLCQATAPDFTPMSIPPCGGCRPSRLGSSCRVNATILLALPSRGVRA